MPGAGPAVGSYDPIFAPLTLPSAARSVESIHLTSAPDPTPTCTTRAAPADNSGLYSTTFGAPPLGS
jgi:hypothetical protein